MKRKYLYYACPLVGLAFSLYYIFTATCDGIYSDYIRLVTSYLPDVADPGKFLVPDLLTRIPFSFVVRLVNVRFFGYNTMFDRTVGAFALFLSGLVLTRYCIRKKLSFVWLVLLTVVCYSLNKWEMLANGSGFAHFLAFACFYCHYELLDRNFHGEGKRKDKAKLLLLPFVTTLLIAGPYCGVYSLTVVLVCFLMWLAAPFRDGWRGRRDEERAAAFDQGSLSQTTRRSRRKANRRRNKINSGRKSAHNEAAGRGIFLLCGFCTLIPFLLYLWSNSYAVEDHAAPAAVSLFTQLKDTPGYFARFFVKSFSSMVLGGETAEELFSANRPFLLLGAAVIALYLLALWLNWKEKLYQETFFPLLLLVSGGLNHVLVLAGRWIFLQENYGLSSRYALQYQSGILGILLTFALILKVKQKGGVPLLRLAACAACVLFLAGNCFTSYQEMKKAPYRRRIYEKRAQISLNYEQYTDDELRENFEFRTNRADSGEKVRKALDILKKNGLGVFRESGKQ